MEKGKTQKITITRIYILERNVSLGSTHMGTLIKDGTEVSALISPKMVVIHVYIFFRAVVI